MPYTLPAARTLCNLSVTEQDEYLGNLFEKCPTLNQTLRDAGVFHIAVGTHQDLIEGCRMELGKLLKTNPNDERVAAIIAAHPRLGGGNAKPLSAHSAMEQASLQSSPEELERLRRLNVTYEETFPGLRYVVFVNGRSRAEVMMDMERRIAARDIEQEKRAAFNAMCDIALDRAAKLQRL